MRRTLLVLIAGALQLVNGQSLFDAELGIRNQNTNNGGINLPPRFLPGGDMDKFSLPEDTPVGTIVYRLRGEDPEGSRVAYSISGDHLSVVRNTGAVTLVKALDRETQDIIEVIITITDEKGSNTEPNIVSIRREIVVEDRNDNAPKFGEPTYSFPVDETAPVGSQIFNKIFVSDADAGSNAEVKLTCLKQISPEACDKFILRAQQLSPGKYAGVLTLREPLNYEENSRFSVAIQAEDMSKEPGARLSSTATVIVEVQDIQDQLPVFLNAPYRTLINENSPAGMSVYTVLVRDGDTGQPRQLTLDLVDDPSGYFRIASFRMEDDGVATASIVTSDVAVDREADDILGRSGVYSFGLKATELVNGVPTDDFTIEQVTVVVMDVNDQPPLFDQDNYVVAAPENLGIGESLPNLEMTVTDKDTGVHGQFELSLSPVRNAENLFEIYPESAVGRTPVLLRVADAEKLDYENPDRREIVVEVVARGGAGLSSTATVTIQLTDVNDNKPNFQWPSYRYTVAENSVPGSLITRLDAVDLDSGPFGQLRYDIRGFGANKFSVNETTGDLFVGLCGLKTCLDYEERDSYTLTYTATDGGGKATSVQVIVNIEDVNDNPPVFDQVQYRRHVLNNAVGFEPPLVVRAEDKDGARSSQAQSLHGGRVFYTIESGNTPDGLFSIDHDSGIIDLTRRINASELTDNKFFLTVRATDSGTPPQHSDSIVIISVGAVEGNDPPKFQQDTYNAHIAEHAMSDSFVVQVNATDPDGPSDQIRYHLAGGPVVDWFAVDDLTGVVRIAPESSLEWDQESTSLTLSVLAVDQGQPHPATATATLNIQMDDVNDRSPRFTKEIFVHHVAEVTPVGAQVLVLAANDPDTNPQLRFRLIEPFQTRNKGGYLRNETESQYFAITETTGILTLIKPLDHENAAVILFRAEVMDVNADPLFANQTDIAEVAIYVQAHTDNGPIFSPPWSPAHPIIRVGVVEELAPETIILTLQAHDPLTGLLISHFELVKEPKPIAPFADDPQARALTSLFDGLDNLQQQDRSNSTAEDVDDVLSFIELNSLTGEISFRRRVDYEELTNKTLQFQVQAIAGELGSLRVSQATVQLEIIDTNDNSPQFTQAEYQVRVNESIRHPESLLTVEATDKDSGKFGQILYFVSGDGADIFVIEDPSTGVVRVAPNVSLDREKQPSYTFTVIAADQPQGSEEQKRSSALVTVEVSDVNDNAPTFTQSSYTAVVPENAQIDWSVSQVQALDPDEGPGGTVEYMLVGEGRLEGLLSVVPNTGDIVVKGPLTGKGRSEPYVLTVRAQDHGDLPLFSDIDVNLYIGDITANDGIPSFVKPAFDEQAFVPEEAPVGSSVFQAVAVDPDDPATPNGRLTYKFLDDGTLGTDHASFDIHPASGLVTTKARLDRESKATYTLIVVARDQGTPSQQATRMLQVVVKDIDDHPPQFARTPYDGPLQFSVLEEVDTRTGWEVDTLKANDPDQGENAVIEYLITYGDDAGLFYLERNPDNSARLLVKGRIDRETTDHFLLTIKCFKPVEKPSELRKPYNPQDMSEIQVKVTVKDIDDNDPIFRQNNITTGVRLNAPLHTEVYRFQAVDPDSESGPLSYKLVNISFIRAEHYGTSGTESIVTTSPAVAKTFDLDAATGSLTTSQTYGLFVDGYFLLNVAAWTGDESKARKAYNTLRIYILRDTELMKFVFTKPPPDIKPMLAEFRTSVEQSLDLPLTLNLYESQFYSRDDGALDFTSSSSCFQLVGKDHVFGLKDTQLLLNPERNQRLRSVYDKYGVGDIQRCVPRGALYEINNVEIWLLVIGSVVGAVGLIAALTICCLFTKYESKMKKLVPGIKVVDRPVMVGTLRMQPPMPPGSEGHHLPHRGLVSHHEWSEGVHLETGPRATLARSVL